MSVNKAIILGHITADPTVKHLDGGVTVANFSVATNETFKNKAGEQIKNTEFHNIVVWRQQAEFVEKYARKGLMCYIEGKTTHPKFTDKDGNDRQKTEIVAEVIKMLTWPQDSNPENQGPQNNNTPDGGDDLPY